MASEELQPLQGMSDLVAPEMALWQALEAQARRVFHLYGYSEIRTPVLEKASVFERSLGDTDGCGAEGDVRVRGPGRAAYRLRPEGTAGVIRYVASRGQDAAGRAPLLHRPDVPRERPQAGRKRQFHQVGAEFIGRRIAAADAEASRCRCTCCARGA
jgi:histidyl-tRNA synthetase